MNVTDNALKALHIIKDTPKISAGDFSIKFWGENHHINKYATKKSWLCAGSYIGKLIKAGWVRHNRRISIIDNKSYFYGYILTTKGKEILENNVRKTRRKPCKTVQR